MLTIWHYSKHFACINSFSYKNLNEVRMENNKTYVIAGKSKMICRKKINPQINELRNQLK